MQDFGLISCGFSCNSPSCPYREQHMIWSEAFRAFMSDRRRTLNQYLLRGTGSNASLERSVCNFFFLADTSETVYTHYIYSYPFKCLPVTSG